MSEQNHKNTPDGIKKLTSLLQSPDGSISSLQSWEKQAIMLHLEGWPASQIAVAVNKNPGTVRNTLKKEATQKVISDYEEFTSREYESLYNMAVNAIRDGLDPDKSPLTTRTEIAKFFIKNRTEKQKPTDDDNSAEALVQKIVNIYQYNNNVTQETVESSKNIPIPPKENE